MSGPEPREPEDDRRDDAEYRPLDDEEYRPRYELGPPPMFAHPQWSVGVVLTIGVVMVILGTLGHPLWLLIGSPFILTLTVWIWVRVVIWRRRRAAPEASEGSLPPNAE